jgi:hypothetical protein
MQYDSEHFEASVDCNPERFWCAWGDISVVAVGQVDIQPESHPMAPSPDVQQMQRSMGVLGNLGGGSLMGRADVSMPPLAASPVAEKVLVVEVYTNQGVGLTLHACHLTYTHLGNRMQASSTDNMRETLRDVATHAAQASCTDAVARFLEGGNLRAIHFADLRGFEDDVLWTLQARRQGWLGAGPGMTRRPQSPFDALEL